MNNFGLKTVREDLTYKWMDNIKMDPWYRGFFVWTGLNLFRVRSSHRMGISWPAK